MGENVDEIEARIRNQRHDLGRNLRALENKARDLTDWRLHYRRNPAWFLGAAAGAGVMLGLLAGRARSLRTPALVYDYPHEPGFASPGSLKSRVGQQLGDTWTHITDALLAVGSAKLVELVSDAIPALRDHLDSRPGPRTRASY